MSETLELNEFEIIILSHALAYGKVESGNVGTQIQHTLKEKGLTTSYYDVFEQNIARLQKRGLIDDKRLPTHHSLDVIPIEILRNSIFKAHRRIAELEEDVRKRDSEASQLRNQIYTLQREQQDARMSIEKMSPPTQIISKESLLKGVEHFIGYDIVNKLSPVAKSDLEDAIKCIFHGIATPAAMVSLRASEDAVRKYYELKTGQTAGMSGWKDILDQLLQRTDVNRILMGHLDYIRVKRNEAEHPEKLFSQKEAENTFLEVTSAIAEIYKEK